MEAFVPIESNTIVERIVAIESRDPFNDEDYARLADAIKNSRKRVVMAGRSMDIKIKGKYVNVSPSSGELLPCGNLEVEVLLRHHA